jgi:hypothetical protein
MLIHETNSWHFTRHSSLIRNVTLLLPRSIFPLITLLNLRRNAPKTWTVYKNSLRLILRLCPLQTAVGSPLSPWQDQWVCLRWLWLRPLLFQLWCLCLWRHWQPQSWVQMVPPLRRRYSAWFSVLGFWMTIWPSWQCDLSGSQHHECARRRHFRLCSRWLGAWLIT